MDNRTRGRNVDRQTDSHIRVSIQGCTQAEELPLLLYYNVNRLSMLTRSRPHHRLQLYTLCVNDKRRRC